MRKVLALSLAVAVWLAKPALVVAEVVYGLRAVEAGIGIEAVEEEHGHDNLEEGQGAGTHGDIPGSGFVAVV